MQWRTKRLSVKRLYRCRNVGLSGDSLHYGIMGAVDVN
jgi:hypothetical protein